MNSTLVSAIRNHQVIQFHYSGGQRIVEPFCYGLGTSNNELLRAYQIGGYSESGSPVGWKLLKVEEMSPLVLTGQEFHNPRPGYNPNDSAMREIYAHF